jgi:non-specific serine/threonine protein kinase
MTQLDLGLAVGYSAAQIARLEGGSRLPDVVAVKGVFVEALDLKHEPALAAQLVRLAEQARSTNAQTDAVDEQPARSIKTNLPIQLTRFIGREGDVAELQQLVKASRLLTLTGSGGAGKSRLAQQVASQFVDATNTLSKRVFLDGVWLVELAPLTNPELVDDAVASAIGLQPTHQPARTLLMDNLSAKDVLLLLDNCEHLIYAIAQLAESLLRACPKLHILATSREALNVPGEVAWRVPSLPKGEAVQLFAERAAAAKPDFQFNQQNSASIEHICERLDNIPLAIELAASRLRTFSVEQIAARLDNRFQLLTGGTRTALPRHQTLRALIDWSYGLLEQNEQRLLRWLSVFAGGWTLDAAELIDRDKNAIDLLSQLVNKSLVNVEESGVEPRYWMLETIRQYGYDKLREAGELQQAHDMHVDICINLLVQSKPHLHGPDQVFWLDRVEAEIENLRAALAWAVKAENSRSCGSLLDGVRWMWYERGYYAEGLKWIDDVLAINALDDDVRIITCVAAGWLAFRIGDFSRAKRDFALAVTLAQRLGNPYWIIWANTGRGFLTADHDEASQLLTEASRLALASGLQWEEIQARSHLGVRSRLRGDIEQAEQLLSKALADYRRLNDPAQIAWVLSHLGLLRIMQGDVAQARQLLEESVELARQLKFPIRIGYALVQLAAIALHQNDIPRAMEAVKESFHIFQSIGNMDRIGQCLAITAGIAFHHRQHERAALLLGAADRLWHEYQSQGTYYQDVHAEFNRYMPLIRAELVPAEFERAFLNGQRMTLQQAIVEAMAV